MSYAGALEALDRVLNRGGEADDVLRAIVDVLHERLGCWIAILFVEGEELVVGPRRGEPDEHNRRRVPIAFRGDRVGELAADLAEYGDRERALLERVALLISPYCLVGWDQPSGWDEVPYPEHAPRRKD